MWQAFLYVLPLALSTLAIRVPVEGKYENVTDADVADKKQDTFYITDGGNIDSYLIPPDPHVPVAVLPEVILTPATYLLPPAPEKQIDYYAPTQADEQTDWYPIAQQAPQQNDPTNILLPPRQHNLIPVLINNQTFDLVENTRGGRVYEAETPVGFRRPSIQLQPPVENASNDFLVPNPSEDQDLPELQINQPFRANTQEQKPLKPYRKNSKKHHKIVVEPTLALHLTPPKPEAETYKKPTKLYPKKVAKGFQPIPIPLSEYAEHSDVPRAKPAKLFKPVLSENINPYIPDDDKNIYFLKKAQQQLKIKGENELQLQQPVAAAEDTYGVNAPAEQETSATIYRHPGRNVYPAPLRQAPPSPPTLPQKNGPPPLAPGERTEFRMHGMKGPHSYQFGFDTGKGKNRQFRFEERDNDGRVKGHYGYMDRSGKLRVVNYGADPETGFHADSPSETPTGGSSGETAEA